MTKNLLQRLLDLPEEEVISFMGDQPLNSPEHKTAEQALEILHRRQVVNFSKKDVPNLWSTILKYIKIFWAPVVFISTIIGIWNQEFWDFLSGVWSSVF